MSKDIRENELKKLYEEIFKPEFLIRYGYYDTIIKKSIEEYEDSRLDLDIYGQADNFFTGIFNMNLLADYIVKNKKDLETKYFSNFSKKGEETEPVYFNIPKSIETRRQYKIPNIFSYLKLAYFISEERKEFTKIFISNKFSSSKYFNQFDFNFKYTNEMRESLYYSEIKRLNLDLSNFYHTLYTHSIPWMLLGKENSKKNREDGFANILDKLSRDCQYGETYGIPTGNLISRIVAELYMCYFDNKIEEKGYRYSRYVDDICFPFTEEENKNGFIKEINLICREHNLIINDKKTKIEVYPFSNVNDKYSIFNFFKNFDIRKEIRRKYWIKEISNFIDYCVNQEALGNKGSVKCIFKSIEFELKKLHEVGKDNEINQILGQYDERTNFNLFEKIIDLSLKNSTLANRFIYFFDKMAKYGFSREEAKKIFKNYFSSNKKIYVKKIKYYRDNQLNQELYQILLYAVLFNIKNIYNKKNLLDIIEENTDDFSLILTTILYIKNYSTDNNLLEKIDTLFKNTHKKYGKNNSRMQEKLWLYRYFIYSLQKQKIVDEKLINKYCIQKGYKTSPNKGYQTELKWRSVRDLNKDIDKFYNELLEEKIWLIDCGKDNKFEY